MLQRFTSSQEHALFLFLWFCHKSVGLRLVLYITTLLARFGNMGWCGGILPFYLSTPIQNIARWAQVVATCYSFHDIAAHFQSLPLFSKGMHIISCFRFSYCPLHINWIMNIIIVIMNLQYVAMTPWLKTRDSVRSWKALITFWLRFSAICLGAFRPPECHLIETVFWDHRRLREVSITIYNSYCIFGVNYSFRLWKSGGHA